MSERKSLTYFPSVFDVADIDQAKRIILTDEGSTTEQRWQTETPRVAELIARTTGLGPASLVMDYGCGIGRMAKMLIEKHGCQVVGVDISAKMRALAPNYVGSERFVACSLAMLDVMVRAGLRFDAAISIWVLQHCLRPAEDIALIRRGLKHDGRLFVLNNIYRAVPTKEMAWVNDGIDIRAVLSEQFTSVEAGTLPPDAIAVGMTNLHFWGSFTNSAGLG